jgi:hypothetical protein
MLGDQFDMLKNKIDMSRAVKEVVRLGGTSMERQSVKDKVRQAMRYYSMKTSTNPRYCRHWKMKY